MNLYEILNTLHKVEDQGPASLDKKEKDQLIYNMTEFIKAIVKEDYND
jgi:hypothetical protein